jgi:hypothetical protein
MKTIQFQVPDEDFEDYQAVVAVYFEGCTDGHGKPLGLERLARMAFTDRIKEVALIVQNSKRHNSPTVPDPALFVTKIVKGPWR